VKIADFGFAKKVTGENCLKTLCGTAQYVAPEILDLKCDGYDQRADVWSLGIVTYVLLGGYAPFDGPLEGLAGAIMLGEFEFHEDGWKNISPAAKDMITSMLQVRPERRVTAGEALSCKWMEVEEESLTLKDLSGAQRKLRLEMPVTEKIKTAVRAVRTSDMYIFNPSYMSSVSHGVSFFRLAQIITPKKWMCLAGVAENVAKKGTVSIQQARIPCDFYFGLYSHDFTPSLIRQGHSSCNNR
jgi:serine/threonine protein kinase